MKSRSLIMLIVVGIALLPVVVSAQAAGKPNQTGQSVVKRPNQKLNALPHGMRVVPPYQRRDYCILLSPYCPKQGYEMPNMSHIPDCRTIPLGQ